MIRCTAITRMVGAISGGVALTQMAFVIAIKSLDPKSKSSVMISERLRKSGRSSHSGLSVTRGSWLCGA